MFITVYKSCESNKKKPVFEDWGPTLTDMCPSLPYFITGS